MDLFLLTRFQRYDFVVFCRHLWYETQKMKIITLKPCDSFILFGQPLWYETQKVKIIRLKPCDWFIHFCQPLWYETQKVTEAERRVMAVTLSSIKILLLEQGSMSATTNNRILGGGGLHASLGRWVRPGRRGALLCASLGRCGRVPWEAAPGRSDDTCPLTCTKPSGEFFFVSKCFS